MFRTRRPLAAAAGLTCHFVSGSNGSSTVGGCTTSPPKLSLGTSSKLAAGGSKFETLEGVKFRIFERQSSGAPLVRVLLKDLLHDLTAPPVRLVLFGEDHGHPLCHRLEKDIYDTWLGRNGYAKEGVQEPDSSSSSCNDGSVAETEEIGTVALSLEMLSTERQGVADEYVGLGLEPKPLQRYVDAKAAKEQGGDASKGDEEAAMEDAEALFGGEWHNWRDYAPLVRSARRHGQRIVCANAPRRLTSIVSKGGAPALDQHLAPDSAAAAAQPRDDRRLLPPLPLRRPSENLIQKIGPLFETFRGEKDLARRDRMLLAQSLWDATMAHAIVGELVDPKGSNRLHNRATLMSLQPGTGDSPPAQTGGVSPAVSKVMHVCGRLHVEHFLGVFEHLTHYQEIASLRQRPPSDSSSASRKQFSMEDREQTRVVVCLPSDESTSLTDKELATNPYLVNAADFVVICEECSS
mmetsp:Transcript_64210/g.126123  ORF Transcript_64210/g.126123 Transcript_64210/m.126123 type:complete len:464 (+) Transcript_64210:154-1545(+)